MAPTREDVENATLILEDMVKRHSDMLTAGCVKVLVSHLQWLLLDSAAVPGIINSSDERNVTRKKNRDD